MKILFISLGCDKNLVDSEHMLGILSERGYGITDDEADADIIIINTCSFIHDAKEESVANILEMAEYRRNGSCKALIVCGCLAQLYRNEILDEIPEVDAVIGTIGLEQIADAIEEVLKSNRLMMVRDPMKEDPDLSGKRLVTTGGHYEYLKIAEGCNKRCTYCIIPSLRGAYRSVPMEELLKEAAELARQGVKELVLVAQETTLYGIDLYGKKSLHLLIKELCKISGIQWIRILYCYPEEIYPELIDVMKEEPKVCHYLDLPIQHSEDEILKRMGRRTSHDDLVSIIKNLRAEIPDIALRTTLITGFPGETEENHRNLMAFIEEMRFDRLGVFTYSREENTPAGEMEDQIPEETKEIRKDALMSLQQDISLERGEAKIGRELYVMVEGFLSEENAYVCRTYADAPNVDGYFFLNTSLDLQSGDFVPVRVTGSLEYDLIGECTDEFTE